MNNAISACSNEAAGRKRRPKQKKCPSYKNMMNKIEEDFADEACILFNLGWIDEQGNENHNVSKADVMSLNPAIVENLDGVEIEKCAGKAL